MCCEEGEGERERLRLGRVAQQRGRVRVVREWGVGGVEQRGREGGRVGKGVKGWKNVGILQ